MAKFSFDEWFATKCTNHSTKVYFKEKLTRSERITRCKNKLIEISKRRGTITYGELAEHLGVANRSVGRYLDPIYNDLVIHSGLPDLTLLVVYSGTKYGRYNSPAGHPSRTKLFDPQKPAHRREYDNDRELVYQHWA